MIISFGDDTFESQKYVLNSLATYALGIEYHDGVTGFPAEGAIFQVNDDAVIICDVDDAGAIIVNSRYHVGYDQIQCLTIL